MRTLILALSLTFAAPVLAQDALPEAEPDEGRPIDSILELFIDRAEEAMRDMVEGLEPELNELLQKMEPEMQRLMGRILPELQALSEMVGGIDNYEMPEVLPNGDIIIRRKNDAPPLPEGLIDEDESIEL